MTTANQRTGSALGDWPVATMRMGLTLGAGDPPHWIGTHRGVTMDIAVGPDDDAPLTVTVPLAACWRSAVVVRVARALSGAGRLLTGDPEFDGTVALYDRGPELLGAFDLATRRLVLRLVGQLGVSVADGALRLVARTPETWEFAAVQDALDALATVAGCLAQDRAALATAALQIASADPDPLVRSQYGSLFPPLAGARTPEAMFERLVQAVSDTYLRPDARIEAARELLATFPLGRVEEPLGGLAAPFVRACAAAFVAATLRPDADLDAAIRILEHWLATEATTFDTPQALALIARLGAFGARNVRHALAAWCKRSDPDVGAAALAALMALELPRGWAFHALDAGGHRRAANHLPRVLREHPALVSDLVGDLYAALGPSAGTLKATILAALEATGKPHWGPLLAAQLADPDADVVVAALDALAAIGTPAAIAAIAPLTEGLFRPGRVKDAAKAAIDAIETRHQTGDLGGAVSLTDDTGGALSLSAEREPDP